MNFFKQPTFARVIAATVGLGIAGCATTQIPPATLTAEGGAAAFAGRSLSDPGLMQYLRGNLGRVPSTWDFETLCWVGFYYQPSLAVARAEWAASVAAQTTAAARANPSLTLTPGYDFTHQAGVSPWMPSIGADFLVPTGGKRGLQQDIAAADADAARLAAVSAAWAMRSALRKALQEATGATRRVDVLRRQADVEQRLVALLQQRYEAGSIAATEVSTARVALLRAETAAADAETQLATARARVAIALGVPSAALDGVALPAVAEGPTLTPAQFALARREALQSRADVLAALDKYRAADATLRLELRKRFPDVHLGPSYQYDQGLNKWSLGITFEVPIFNHNEGPIAEAKARRDQAEAQFVSVQNQAVGAIDAAVAASETSSLQVRRAHALQAEAEHQAELARQRRSAGAGDAVEEATAEVDRAVAESALLDAESVAAVATGELEDALQIPFPHLAEVLRAGASAATAARSTPPSS